MARHTVTALAVVLLGLGIVAHATRAQPAGVRLALPSAASAHASPAPSSGAAGAALITEYCLGCHDRGSAKGDLVLEDFDTAHPEKQAEIAEKMIHKLRAGLMPPTGKPRPDAAAIASLVTSLETQLDLAAASHPNPGSRPFQRLNRAEYGRSIRDLLALDVDVEAFLPPDTISHGFDNVADVQAFSPALMQGYMRAASKISREAVGDPHATPASTTYKVPRTASQAFHIDGTPFGTRGGLAIVHNFPADAEYIFKIAMHPTPTGGLFGSTARGEQLEVSVNGERVALLDINPRMSESDPNGMNLETKPVAIKAGPQRISASFIQRFDGPVDDLIAPIEHTLADTQIGSSPGITTLPHLRDLAIAGPYRVTGVSDTPSRRKIFTCRPAAPKDERGCATQILTDLARQAYRRPLQPGELDGLLGFFEQGRKGEDFDTGIRTALQALLASPNFVFRLERTPASVKPGQDYRIGDLELASRLSFFLWAAAPDADLVAAASTGGLRKPGGLEAEVRRMLADPRAETLASRFAGQWLRLQDLAQMHPDALLYPQYDESLGRLMRRETELLFTSIVREDRNVLDLLTADYTYVNDRLAAHYRIPNVSGSNFQRVPLADDYRRGLLGQGSILTLTSVADRTSPVQRGKWVLEVLLGTPPPPPPPVVPLLEETKAVVAGHALTVRERMEEHRKNPQCASCHRVIDPIGLALENFDPTGRWRIKDSGSLIDPASALYDGTPLTGPASLRQALLNHGDVVLRNFTVELMTYGLGRRVEYYDMPAVRAIVRDAAKNKNRFSSFILGIVKSPAFQMSRVDDATPATGGKGNSGGK